MGLVGTKRGGRRGSQRQSTNVRWRTTITRFDIPFSSILPSFSAALCDLCVSIEMSSISARKKRPPPQEEGEGPLFHGEWNRTAPRFETSSSSNAHSGRVSHHKSRPWSEGCRVTESQNEILLERWRPEQLKPPQITRKWLLVAYLEVWKLQAPSLKDDIYHSAGSRR